MIKFGDNGDLQKNICSILLWLIVFIGHLNAFALAADVPKIIIDSDYNTLSDDGQLGVMAAQLQAAGKLEVLGVTVVSGNLWLKQGVAEALKSVERIGVEKHIGVYSGANYPLSHDLVRLQADFARYPNEQYWGAWSNPEPVQKEI